MSVCLMKHMGRARNERLSLSVRSHKERLIEIAGQLEDTQFDPYFIDEEPAIDLKGEDVWASPIYPTKVKWERNPITPYVAYQFDGHSSADLKNPIPDEKHIVFHHLRERGYAYKVVGGHMSLYQCVCTLAHAALFVGCDSGMSHVAHSVGVPVYLLQYHLPVETCHRGKQYVLCNNAEHFINQARPYLDMLRHIAGLGDFKSPTKMVRIGNILVPENMAHLIPKPQG